MTPPAPAAPASARAGRRRRIHVPDAPGDRAATRRARCPICGMALEPTNDLARRRAEPRARRHEAPLLVSAALTVPLFVLAMGEMLGRALRAAAARRARCTWLAARRSRRPSSSGAAGPSSCAAWTSVRHAPAQHVHADRARHGRGLRSTASSRRSRRARLPARRSAAIGGRSRVYFEAAAVITTLVLLGQVLELRARSRTGARDPRAARPRAEDRAARRATTAPRRTCRSSTCRSATACACGRARRFPSTASLSRAELASTSR